MPIIPIAMALAQLAPSLMKLFGAEEPSIAAAKTVTDIAQVVTGTASPEAALKHLQESAAAQRAFNELIVKNEHEISLALLKDVQDARARDSSIQAEGKRNYRADAMLLLAVLVICLLIYIIWKETELNEYVKGTFTFILGRFTGYLDSIYNFEFGSTRNSKEKDVSIANLSKGV